MDGTTKRRYRVAGGVAGRRPGRSGREGRAAAARETRVLGVEGLRGVAAGTILVYHVWLFGSPDGTAVGLGRLDAWAVDLAYGVTLFFALSGFLLYRPFAAAVVRARPLPGTRRYFRNRALRILPAYWVIFLLCSLIVGGVAVRESVDRLQYGRVHDPGELLKGALLLQHYTPDGVATGITPAWSLAVEIAFYALLPMLGLVAWRLGRTQARRSLRRLAALVPALFLLGLGLSGKAVSAWLLPPASPYDGWRGDWHSVLERSFLTHADLFAFGMALAVLMVDVEDRVVRLPRWTRWAAGLGALSCYAVTRATVDVPLSYAPTNTLMGLAAALVLAFVILAPRRSLLLGLMQHRAVVLAGVISYSVFLWHEPLVHQLAAHGLTTSGRGGFLLNIVLTAGVTGFLAWLTYRFVEAPALRRKRSRVASSDSVARVPAEQPSPV